MMRWPSLILALVLLLGATAGATVPPPSPQEVQLGKTLAAEIEKRYEVSNDPALLERLNRVAKPIIAATDREGVTYVLKILNVEVANAVSLPGGYIYVTKPMFTVVRSDHELAAILAHEMAHIAHAHHLEMQRRQSQATLITILVAALTRNPTAARGVQLASIGVLGSFSRDLERDADLTAITYLQKTPYNPLGELTLMERFAFLEQYTAGVDPGAFADHPKTSERVTYIAAELRRRGIPIVRRLTANYLRLAVREEKERGGTGGELLVNEQVILRLPDMDKVREVVARLDRLFNADLRSFEVEARSDGDVWTVVARGTTIVTISPRDAAWNKTSAKDLAQSIYARLRAVMEEDLRLRKLNG